MPVAYISGAFAYAPTQIYFDLFALCTIHRQTAEFDTCIVKYDDRQYMNDLKRLSEVISVTVPFTPE